MFVVCSCARVLLAFAFSDEFCERALPTQHCSRGERRSTSAGRSSVEKVAILVTDGNPTICSSNDDCDTPLENCINGDNTDCPAADAAAALAATAMRNDGIR